MNFYIIIKCVYSLNKIPGLFHSKMSYSKLFWGSTSFHNLQKIFILQKKAIRIIEKKNKNETCKELILKSQILSVPLIYIFEFIICKCLYKKFNRKCQQSRSYNQTSKFCIKKT